MYVLILHGSQGGSVNLRFVKNCQSGVDLAEVKSISVVLDLKDVQSMVNFGLSLTGN